MKVGSLFSGVGGFDVAAERAGMTVAWQSENDKHASEVLAEHWPEVPNYGDIHDITEPPAVDVLVGGFPCQDYSVAGLRDGLVGDRGALWWEFHRLIDDGRPRWVVGENVPGLLSSRGGADFAVIIDSLTELGYRVAWRVLDAQYFGVAQRRRRVFIVAHSGNKSPSQVLALAEGLCGYPAPSRETGQKPAPTLSARTQGGGGLGTDFDLDGGLIPEIHPPLMAHSYKSPNVEGGEDVVIPFAQNTRDEVRIVDEDNGAQISGALAAEPGMKQQTYIMRQRESKPGGGKGPLLSEDRSLTLAANTNDQTLFANQQVRRLTPTETERLQGFDDGWTATQSDMQRYRQMGNAVAVPVAEWVMRRIVEEDDR